MNGIVRSIRTIRVQCTHHPRDAPRYNNNCRNTSERGPIVESGQEGRVWFMGGIMGDHGGMLFPTNRVLKRLITETSRWKMCGFASLAEAV